MEEQHHTKEVYYDKWCPKCEYRKLEEKDFKPEDPCWDCLTQGFNIDSHKPVCFKEKGK